jgi:uncharacterized protein (TIGR02246 family)
MAQDDTAIRTASAGWNNAAQSKDLEQALTFFADDGILLAPKSPAVLGKENIRKLWRQMLAIPGPGASRPRESRWHAQAISHGNTRPKTARRQPRKAHT